LIDTIITSGLLCTSAGG